MPNKKISELNELTIPDTADLLAIVDVSASETMRITLANLLAGLLTNPLTENLDLGTYNINNVDTIYASHINAIDSGWGIELDPNSNIKLTNSISAIGQTINAFDGGETQYIRMYDTGGAGYIDSNEPIHINATTLLTLGTEVDITGALSCDTQFTIGDTTMTEQNLIDLLALL